MLFATCWRRAPTPACSMPAATSQSIWYPLPARRLRRFAGRPRKFALFSRTQPPKSNQDKGNTSARGSLASTRSRYYLLASASPRTVYARYSSDRQRPASIQDQLRKCREFAEREGWQVLDEHVYIDEAQSGAGSDRPGFVSLIK